MASGIRKRVLREPSDGQQNRAASINPTADLAIARADGEDLNASIAYTPMPKVRPMRIERLRAMGGPYTDEDRARLLYDEHKSSNKVAELMGRPVRWVREVCAWDIQQRRQSRTA